MRFPGPRTADAVVASAQLSYERSRHMAGKSKGGDDKDHRSSISGKYVTEDYAKRHPKTTQSETRKK